MKTTLTGLVVLSAFAIALPSSARAQHVLATFRDIDGTVSNLALTAAEYTALQKRAQEDNRVLPKATDRIRKKWGDDMKVAYGFDGPAAHPFPLPTISSELVSSLGAFDTHQAAVQKKKEADAKAAELKKTDAPAPAAGADPAAAQKADADRAALWQQLREAIIAAKQDAAAATNVVTHVKMDNNMSGSSRTIKRKEGKKLGDPEGNSLIKTTGPLTAPAQK